VRAITHWPVAEARSSALAKDTVMEFHRLIDKAEFRNTDFTVRTDSNNATVIHVIAYRGDIATWQKIVETFESSERGMTLE
jgi:hypothetical protein